MSRPPRSIRQLAVLLRCGGVLPWLLAAATTSAAATPGGAADGPPAARPGTASSVYRRLTLKAPLNGIDGALELLQDPRITAELRERMWGMGDVDFVLDHEEPLWKALHIGPLANARLRVVDARGREMEENALAVPVADLEVELLYEDAMPTFLVSEDYSAGTGSSGPSTSLYEVRGGKLGAVELPSMWPRQALGSTLHMDWRIVEGRQGKGKEIELVYCHPREEGPRHSSPERVVEYVTYRFDGKAWRLARRSATGHWESGDPWPPRHRFP